MQVNSTNGHMRLLAHFGTVTVQECGVSGNTKCGHHVLERVIHFCECAAQASIIRMTHEIMNMHVPTILGVGGEKRFPDKELPKDASARPDVNCRA